MFTNLIKTRPLTDRTKGFRFDCMGIKGIYRQRKVVKRYEIKAGGDTFLQLHIGKRSLYIEQLNPTRQLFDFALRNRAIRLAQYAKATGLL